MAAILLYSVDYIPAYAQDSSGTVEQWKSWKQTLISEDTVRPVTVVIEFENSGKKFNTVAFTDDGIHYIFSAAFPETGSWKWTTHCSNKSDKGLHNLHGKVEVVRYAGTNPLYLHGDLKVSVNRRYLVYADDTPFLWIGDTGWNASLKSTMEEWRTYVDKRASQSFSVIQISPRGYGNRLTASEKPDVSFTADGKPDTAFWSDLERKIAYANDKGIMILLVGTGNAWRDRMAQNPVNQKFEYYIAGRLAGHMVIFSPSFDQVFTDELDKVAAELGKWTRHLITQHPGANIRAGITFRNSRSVDFTGMKSGPQGGDLKKAYSTVRQWTLDMWGGAPVKPVVMLETMYDSYGNNDAPNFREMDSRKTGWLAWMSGARGITYGCGDVSPNVPVGHGGVWMFNKDSSTYDYWRKAINWRSAGQMTKMRDFLSSFEWWKQIPSPDLIRNQEESDTLQMMTSKSEDLKTIIAYLPHNDRIVLDMTIFEGTFNCTWYNPQTGEYTPPIKANGGEENKVFTRPEGWDDAVLKIYRI